MVRSRVRIVVAGSSVVAFVGACVDLFHSTDFVTLCSADAAVCSGDAMAKAEARDATTDVAVAIDFCAWSPAESRAHAERACAWVGACQGALPKSSFGACMLRAQAAYDCAVNPSLRPRGAALAMWTCLANVASCASVGACLFAGAPPKCGPVPTGAFTACSTDEPASAVVECSLAEAVNEPTALEPCVLEGRTCAKVDDSSAVCAGTKGRACAGFARCDGTHAVECKDTTDIGIDCASFGGGRCVRDDAGVVACAPLEDAGACSESSRITCDDAGVARSCVGGLTVTTDCSKLGRPCAEISDSGLDPLAACTDTNPVTQCTGKDECLGDRLSSCAQGKSYELLCSAVGLKSCHKPPPGRPQVATCTPP